MVGLRKSVCYTWMDCSWDADNASKFKKSSQNKQFLQRCFWCSSWCLSRVSIVFWSIVSRIPHLPHKGSFVRRWSNYTSQYYGSTTPQTGVMVKLNGNQKTSSELGKTEIMTSGKHLHSLENSVKHPCGVYLYIFVCRKGVRSNSISCIRC